MLPDNKVARVLRRVEWVGGCDRYCHWCRGWRVRGHRAACELAALLIEAGQVVRLMDEYEDKEEDGEDTVVGSQ